MNKEEIQELHREVMVLYADYNDLKSKLDKVGEKIYNLYIKTDGILNGKESKNGDKGVVPE